MTYAPSVFLQLTTDYGRLTVTLMELDSSKSVWYQKRSEDWHPVQQVHR